MEEMVTALARRQHYDSVEDFYAAIGNGGVLHHPIAHRAVDGVGKVNDCGARRQGLHIA